MSDSVDFDNTKSSNTGDKLKIQIPENLYYNCCCSKHESHKNCTWACLNCISPTEGHTNDATECYPYDHYTCGVALHNATCKLEFSDILNLINAGADPNQQCAMHGTAIIALVKQAFFFLGYFYRGTYDYDDFLKRFNYFIYDVKVDVTIEDHRGRNPLYVILTHRYFFRKRDEFTKILMPLTFECDQKTYKYELKDMFKVCLLSTILGKGGDRSIIDEYYRHNNKFIDWIEQIWILNKKFHILCPFLHESISNIAEYEFKYMMFLEVPRKIFKALTSLYFILKGRRKRLFFQIFFRLIKIGIITLQERNDYQNKFQWCMKDFILEIPLSANLFNHLNGLYYVNPNFELEHLFYCLYTAFNSWRNEKTRIPNTDQKLLDFLFPFITPLGLQKILEGRINEGDQYDHYPRYSILDCFESYAERFFPFELYKKAASLKCTYKVQPFPLKRIARDAIRDAVFKHDCDPNKFIRNISSFKCLPKTIRWYLRFVLPSAKI